MTSPVWTIKIPRKRPKTPAPGAETPAKDDDKPYEPELHL